MPIDSSIYSQVGQGQQQPVNPLAQLAQVEQIRRYQALGQKEDREATQQNALLNVMRSPEFQKGDATTRANLAYGTGSVDAAGKITTSAAAAAKDTREAEKFKLEADHKQWEAIGQVAGTVTDQPSYQRGLQILQQRGIDTSKFNPNYDPAGVKQFADAAMTRVQQIETQYKALTLGETQRHNLASEGTSARTAATGEGQLAVSQGNLATRQQELGAGKVPSGYRPGAGGALEFIPGGPADPTTKPAGGKPLNEGQSKALLFGTRMAESNDILESLAAQGTDQPGLIKRGAEAMGVGGAANWTQSSNQQQVEQAQRDFINATLRRESGAAIAESEFVNAKKQYFPQVADKPEVIANKKRNREVAMRGILAEVPESEQRVAQVRGKPAGAAQAPSGAIAPPPAALAHLKANPGLRAAFEAKYGPGSAASVLGQ